MRRDIVKYKMIVNEPWKRNMEQLDQNLTAEKENNMITAGDFKNGLTFEMDGKVYQVIEFQHVKPGKGAAFVRTKYRDVVSGATREASFNPTAKFEQAQIERRDLEYLYNDGELYYFMDEEFNMEPLDYSQVEDALKYIKENDPVIVRSYKGSAFSVECENFVTLRVTQADPSVKGNTATNATKEAILETGVSIQVPMFVEQGELIRVDTRTGEYMERVKG